MYWICFIYLLHTSIPCGKYTHTRVTSTTVFSHTVTRNIILSLNEYAMMCFFDALECMNISPPMLLWIERCDGDFISFKKQTTPEKKRKGRKRSMYIWLANVCFVHFSSLHNTFSFNFTFLRLQREKRVWSTKKRNAGDNSIVSVRMRKIQSIRG